MPGDIPLLTPSTTDKVVYQNTTFTLDALGRNICNTLEEALTNPNFDAIVIGAGMFGGYAADKIYRDGASKNIRVLVLDAGPFLVSQHVQDLPAIGLDVPAPITPGSDGGQARDLVWGIPWVSNVDWVGTAYCVGGKSIYWGGWCPRLTAKDLADWPKAVADYLNANYPTLEQQLGVAEPTDFIQGDLYTALLRKAKDAVPSVPNLVAVEPPPLGVVGKGPASGLFSINKYSSVPLLVSAVRDAINESGGDDARRRLFVVPRAHVSKLHTINGSVSQIELYINGQQRFINVAPQCAVVLAVTSIESTRLALESFPTSADPNAELIGRNFTVHMRSNTSLKIKKSALDPTLPKKLQTAAVLVRGDTGHGEFHLQVTAADDPNGDSDVLLYRMIPDIDQVDTLINNQQADWIALTIRGCAQMFGDKQTPIHDPNKRWIDLSPNAKDEFGFRRAYVHAVTEPHDLTLWDSMDSATRAFALALVGGDASALQLGNTERDGLGTTYHETGTMWMGDDPKSSVTDVNGKFHHVFNAYACDQSLFVTVGSVNPTLTGLTLARKVAEAIVASHP